VLVQLEALRSLQSCERGSGQCHCPLVDNFRPTMPLNGRVVTATFRKFYAWCSAWRTDKTMQSFIVLPDFRGWLGGGHFNKLCTYHGRLLGMNNCTHCAMYPGAKPFLEPFLSPCIRRAPGFSPNRLSDWSVKHFLPLISRRLVLDVFAFQSHNIFPWQFVWLSHWCRTAFSTRWSSSLLLNVFRRGVRSLFVSMLTW